MSFFLEPNDYWHNQHADRAVNFINGLTHTKGKFAGYRFDLRKWQEAVIREIFGKVNRHGRRIIRTVFFGTPRKNGKSELAAAVALYMLFADREIGGEVYSAAAEKDQASIIFNVAAQMARNNAHLKKRTKFIDSQKRMVVQKTGSIYRAISSDAHTKHGFNSSGIMFDELHAQQNRDLWDVLATSTGAREQPLTFSPTTAGYDRHSICYEQYDYAKRIMAGEIEDETFLPVIWETPKDADWTDENIWHGCNPALGDFLSLEALRSAFKRAKDSPAYENTFRRLHLNQWTAQDVRWMPMDAWESCGRKIFTEENFIARPCYGGLDLASTTDVAAFALVFPPVPGDDFFYALCYFWIPEDGIQLKRHKDKSLYQAWVNTGHMVATPGNVIDYQYIINEIKRLSVKFDIQELAFDRWGATKIIQDLEEIGFTVDPKGRGKKLIQFGQGFQSMSAPTKELLNLVLSRKIEHRNNPVLKWMADNMIVRTDPAGNIKPDKGKSSEKIDGMVALIMGLDRALRHQDHKSVYETRGVRVL